MEVIYKTAKKEDAKEMVNVHFESVSAIDSEYYSNQILEAWSPLPDQQRVNWLGDLIDQDSTTSAMALNGQNQVMGFYIVLNKQSELKALYVHPEFSGLGVGAGLLKHAERESKSRGLNTVELNGSFNAEKFYRGQGYRSKGKTSQQLSGGIEMPAVRMIKNLECVA